MRQAAAELQAAAGLQQQDQWDDYQQQQQWEGDSLGLKAAAAAAATAAADDRLSGLLAALGAASEEQAADRHREMVTRLRRLDQVCWRSLLRLKCCLSLYSACRCWLSCGMKKRKTMCSRFWSLSADCFRRTSSVYSCSCCPLTIVLCMVLCCTVQVLPKYQSVVSQLYDRLRVVSLDDLLPAVDRILAQHT